MLQLWIACLILATLGQGLPFEPNDLDVAAALQSHGLDSHQLQHLTTLNGRCSCADACSTLTAQYGSDYVLAKDAMVYTSFREAYWSAIQEDVRPTCVFIPPDAEAISVLILLSRMTQCPFAVKSGGHSAYAGASSIENGITVSLQNLNSIELSADQKIAFVEPGNNWAQAYSRLAEDELTIIGGRVERIGTGGLTLGGGISFFSGLNGWACDNVEAYEVVTASGELVTATPTNYTDLYWAVRGGGNNFGIVTKFHYRTYPIPGNIVWGGSRVYLEPDFTGLINAFTNLAFNADSDPRAGYWNAFVIANSTKLAATTLWYDNPANITNTQIFSNFSSLTPISDTTGPRNLVEFVKEVQVSNPYGLREQYLAFSTKVSAELATFAMETFFADAPSLMMNRTGVNPVLLFQSITVPQMVNMRQNGGNPLGLDPDQGPLFLFSLPVSWQSAADDEAVYTFNSNLATKISDKAKELGLQDEYIYMNYASKFQDVIRGYGLQNKARLIEISQKYDPQGVFQTLQPGYFKLNGPPVESNYFSGSWS